MMNMGITFNLSTDEPERIIPMDLIPRIIKTKEWAYIEKGLKQRVTALNTFLNDVYGKQLIIKNKVIPEEIILGSDGFLKESIGLKPSKGIYIPISGIDIIRDKEGDFFVLEDNVRTPSGVSYMLQARELSKMVLPEVLSSTNVLATTNYTEKLFNTLRYLSDKDEPTIALYTPGIYNSAYYEHSYLALQMGIELVDYRDMISRDGDVFIKTTKGLKKVDVLYRRLNDTYLDPLYLNKNSLIGVPNLFEAYKKGNLALANAIGTGVADDKVIYYFVPEIIKYYLGEEPILNNVKTWLCSNPQDLNYILEHIDQLVIKEANESGGKGMLIGPRSTKEEQNEFKLKIKKNPRNFIAQSTITLSTNPCLIDGGLQPRHIDLRPYVLYGKDIYITPGGLTRVALQKDSLVVNSSQGGGSKDTWVLKN